MKKTVHLICNAHLDPVWLWTWEEGLAEALSTFRVAADCCERFDGFLFNHNESLLYEWVERHDPPLFARIRRLVRQGAWHIMGGWFLQPDCNMPCGESLVRQILAGREYFRSRFGVVPTTAVNVDPFGHSRGLVQILAKSGYDTYLFWRPEKEFMALPSHEFRWIGHDVSEIVGSRSLDCYNNRREEAGMKIAARLKALPPGDSCYLLWGAGNHGGGPTRRDLRDIAALMRETAGTEIDLRHSTPEAYAASVRPRRVRLPRVETGLNPWGPGCYTAQIRVKQLHRRLESDLWMVEKMAAAAALHGRMAWPAREFADAERDLLFCQFHDILPGSAVQQVEENALRRMDHGLEILDQVKARAFLALAQGQPAAPDGAIPVLVCNPHPFPVTAQIDCELNLDRRNREGFMLFDVKRDGKPLPSQVETVASSLPVEWRKRVVFEAELPPAQVVRFDCRPRRVAARPAPALRVAGGAIAFRNESLDVRLDARTGLIDRCRIRGADLLRPGACRPIVVADTCDPWGIHVTSYRDAIGAFRLLSPAEAARFAGVRESRLAPIRAIEDGPVRGVVEALFGYRDSRLVLRYILPKRGGRIGLELRVYWNERDRFLKLALPVRGGRRLWGQVACGVDPLFDDGRECVAQRWVAVERGDGTMLTCVNDGTYGCDFRDGELRLSLLRSPAYAALPLDRKNPLPPDRHRPRIDQGERRFRFWLDAGPAEERLARVDREATVLHEAPMALAIFPPGGGGAPLGPAVRLDGDGVQLSAMKRAVDGDGFILRLFNPTARRRRAALAVPPLGLRANVALGPYELATCRLSPKRGTIRPEGLMERGPGAGRRDPE
jgi:alpha-mannosidase